MFKNIRADFCAHGSDWGAQGFWAMAVYRLGRWRSGVRPPVFRKAFSVLYKVLFKLLQVIAGVEARGTDPREWGEEEPVVLDVLEPETERA